MMLWEPERHAGTAPSSSARYHVRLEDAKQELGPGNGLVMSGRSPAAAKSMGGRWEKSHQRQYDSGRAICT